MRWDHDICFAFFRVEVPRRAAVERRNVDDGGLICFTLVEVCSRLVQLMREDNRRRRSGSAAQSSTATHVICWNSVPRPIVPDHFGSNIFRIANGRVAAAATVRAPFSTATTVRGGVEGAGAVAWRGCYGLLDQGCPDLSICRRRDGRLRRCRRSKGERGDQQFGTELHGWVLPSANDLGEQVMQKSCHMTCSISGQDQLRNNLVAVPQKTS